MKLVRTSVALLFAIAMSGCGQQNQVSCILPNGTTNSQDLKELQASTDNTEAKDTPLEQPDTEVCLDAELSALSQSGGWSVPTSPTTLKAEEAVHSDFPIVINNQVNLYINLFTTSQRNQFANWLSRSSMYRPMIEQQLEAAGLPKDLVFLAMIESGFNPFARSKANAVGLWQFMEGTGEQYNLSVNDYVDERRNVEKSTAAAIAYLDDLYKEFGDWHLAVAAYNGGPGTIRTGLSTYNSDNFWDLASQPYLCMETKRYVPKLIAALIIGKNPQKFGFEDVPYQHAPEYDSLSVGPGMSLKAIALVSNSSIREIQRLNAELRQDRTPLNVSQYDVRIPLNTLAMAEKNMSRLHSIVQTNYKTHKITSKDTLTKICALYNINRTTLLKVNNLRSSKLPVGRNLRIPFSSIDYQLLPENVSGAMLAAKDSLILHKVKKGETLSRISKQYHVPANMIVAWNGLKSAAAIKAGQQLTIYHNEQTNDSERVAQAVPRPSRDRSSIAVLKADERKNRFSKGEGSFLWYSVKDGDSLWTISQKFSATPKEIKKWNNLKSNLLKPGSKLKLKKV